MFPWWGSSSARKPAASRLAAQITPRLTKGDLELAAQIVTGAGNKEIAWNLHLTEGTIRTKIGRISKKLGFYGAGSRVRIAVWYVKNRAVS